MRYLFLDDSGKVHPNDSSKFAVFGGFSLDESRWHAVVRQVAGAKARLHPARNPHEWEIKGTDVLAKDGYKKARNRELCAEVLEVIRRNDGRTYVVFLEKAKAANGLDEQRLVPLCFHRLLAQFLVELEIRQTSGSIVCDWSTHQMDHHVTQSVKSFVASQKLHRLVGGVSYGSSAAHETLQICDVIAGGYRRWLEGNSKMSKLASSIESMAFALDAPAVDRLNQPISSILRVF